MDRVTDPADPRRCKGASKQGQCLNVAVTGSDYCRAHSGQDLTEQRNLHGYLLAKAQDQTRLAEISDHLEPVKELRDSIGLLKMLIERRFNMIKDDNDLTMACGPLNQMLLSMDRLVNSCHKIEQNLGQLLAKAAILDLARQMVAIIVEELEGIDDYEIIVDRITERLINTIRYAGPLVQEQRTTTVKTLPPPAE